MDEDRCIFGPTALNLYVDSRALHGWRDGRSTMGGVQIAQCLTRM